MGNTRCPGPHLSYMLCTVESRKRGRAISGPGVIVRLRYHLATSSTEVKTERNSLSICYELSTLSAHLDAARFLYPWGSLELCLGLVQGNSALKGLPLSFKAESQGAGGRRFPVEKTYLPRLSKEGDAGLHTRGVKGRDTC